MKRKTKGTVIASYSLNGDLLKVYDSAKQASLSNHVFSRGIDKCIREGTTIHEKQFKRVETNNVPKKIEAFIKTVKHKSIQPIAMIDENNIVIRIYPSIRNASILNNTDAHTIRDVLNGKTKHAKGKQYRYLTDQEVEQFGLEKGIDISLEKVAIIQLDLEGKYIKTFKSISEAAKTLNKPNRTQEIRDALKGKYSTAFGYIWKYKDKENVTRKNKPSILQLDTTTCKVINRFKTVKDASISTKISVSSINNCIRGRQKTAGGYIWKRK